MSDINYQAQIEIVLSKVDKLEERIKTLENYNYAKMDIEVGQEKELKQKVGNLEND